MFRPLRCLFPLVFVSRLGIGAAVAGVLFAAAPAQAVVGRAVAQPFLCEADGWCTQPTEDFSLVGGFRQGAQELQFEALYRPFVDPNGTFPYPPWCVRLRAPDGTVYATLYGNTDCLTLWAPNYRDKTSVTELAEQTRRIKTDGVIALDAQQAGEHVAPPTGRQSAWAQVRVLVDHLADTVNYLNAQ